MAVGAIAVVEAAIAVAEMAVGAIVVVEAAIAVAEMVAVAIVVVVGAVILLLLLLLEILLQLQLLLTNSRVQLQHHCLNAHVAFKGTVIAELLEDYQSYL